MNKLKSELYSACRRGSLEDARSAVQKGANPNWENDSWYGWTALMWAAAIEGGTAIVKYLVEETSAQVNTINYDLRTACHYAARNGHLEVVKLLVAHGANIQLRDKIGKTPLELAKQRGHQSVVDYLVNDEIADDFRVILIEVADKLTDEDISVIIIRYNLSKQLTKVKPFPCLKHLQESGVLSWKDTDPLKRLLNNINRHDLVNLIEEYETLQQSENIMLEHQLAQSPSSTTSSSSLSSNYEPQASSLGATGLQNRNLVERHILQQGSVDLLSLKSFFIGPSCVGKTTARRRLTYEIDHISPDEIVPSTGIDAPLTVRLYHETDQSSVLLSEKGWRSLGLKDQCRTLCSHVINTPNPLLVPSNSDTSKPRSSPPAATTTPIPTTHVANDEASIPSQWIKSFVDRLKQTWKRNFTNDTTSSSVEPITALDDEPTTKPTDGEPNEEPIDDLSDLITALSTLVKADDWETIRELLNERGMLTFLHIVDIGGQPECHEILPLLLHGLALNLIFLNVTQDLDSLYTVVYRGDGQHSPIQYKSEFTIREIIQRALCSISSLQTTCSPDHEKPAAILIGTYLDQSSEAAVLTLDRSIQEAFKDAEFMKNDILCPVSKPGDKERYIHPLDNVSGGSSDIEELRRIITTIVHKRFTPVQVPTSTLLLHLILRQRFEVRGWCSLKECVQVARICGISKDDLLKENGILQFLHDRFGTILHYRGLKIGQRVILDTNIVMKPTTELFVYAFGAKEAEPKTADRIRTTGEIPQRLMNKVCSPENVKQSENKIPTSEIVELLVSRYILYENVGKKTTYFMPSLLFPDHKVGKESSDPDLLSALLYSPILLWPSTGFTPLGLFPATVVNLSQNESWNLDQWNRFRNRIRFYVQYSKEKLLYVELRTLSTHLEFRIVCTEPVNPRLIPLVRQELLNAVTKVSSIYPHTQELEWCYGFYCPHAVDSGGTSHPALCQTMEEPQDVVCSLPDCYGGPISLKDRHKCWFLEIQINTESHRAIDVNPKKPGEKLMTGQEMTLNCNEDDKQVPQEKQFVAALKSVTDWYTLGVQLDIPTSQLKDIEQTYHVHGFVRQKTEMFIVWKKSSPNVSWVNLITALKAMGEHNVAREIEACYVQKSLTAECKVSYQTQHQLSRSDLLRVKQLVRQYSDWKSLGIELGLDYQTLEDIQENNPGEKAICKIDMLKSWLDGEDEVTKCGGPTWQQLADCLKRLGQDSLAHNIEQFYLDTDSS